MKKIFAPKVLFIFVLFINAALISSVSARTDTQAAQVSTTVVISQVYSGGGGSTGTYKPDYVELFNVSATPQSLNGLALQYGSATGNFGSGTTLIFALPDVTLQPGQYYLVQTGTVGTGGADLPVTPDATTTNISMAGAGGKIALTNTTTGLGCGATAAPCALPDARIIDLVAFGTGNNGEGGTSTNNGAALLTTQSSVRKGNGCTDTDNNNNDFTVAANPVPRNTASTRNACSGGGTNPTPGDANVDMNGDGKSDYVITRDSGGLKTWWVSVNGSTATSDGQFGLSTDVPTPEDFDGDGKDDLAVWRSGAPNQAAFYIYQTATNTVRTELFGQTGDNPTVVGDYDGDNIADPAVYRPAAAGQQSFFFYRGSANNPNRITTFVPWGRGTLNPYNGDFDGDGKNDFCLFNSNVANNRGQFLLLKSNGFGTEFIDWGALGDILVPGDFDGDGKSDFTVVRPQGGQYAWFTLERDGGGTGASPILWGLTTDSLAPGDYDGDKKQDVAVWRGNADPTMNYFLIRRSTDSALQFFEWGQQGDIPAAGWYVLPSSVTVQ